MSNALDIEDPQALRAYLIAGGWAEVGDRLTLTNLRGGVSNRTVLVDGVRDGPWVMKQALARLRVAQEWLSDPVRIRREAAGMEVLAQLLPPGTVPRLIFEDPHHYLLAMAAVEPPFDVWKDRLLSGRVEMELCERFGAMLAAIHAGSADSAHLSDRFGDRSFFESLRLEPYYLSAARQTEGASPFLHALTAECRTVRLALVHGDYSPKNILVRGKRLILLDHEVIHWGDPAFDIGFALTHLLSKANHLSELRHQFIEGGLLFWKSYCEGLSRGPVRLNTPEFEARAVRHTLACLLARVDGRSPLEYLTLAEQERQRRMVLERMADPPLQIETLVGEWAPDGGR